jgi:hypothetical protein
LQKFELLSVKQCLSNIFRRPRRAVSTRQATPRAARSLSAHARARLPQAVAHAEAASKSSSRVARRAVRRFGPAGRAPDGPPVRSLSRELRTACCHGQDPVPPLHSSWRRKEDHAAAIKGWHHEHPHGPAAHGPSRPPAPLEAAAPSSGFWQAAHPTELSSTSPCICYSFPSHPFACPGRELAQAGGTVAGAGRRRCTPSPAAPPPRPNPQTDAW